MRSMPEDRAARAVIRDERLFAAHWPDAVTLRQVAAQVSPGLVVHHFGSNEGLREGIDVMAIEHRSDARILMSNLGGR